MAAVCDTAGSNCCHPRSLGSTPKMHMLAALHLKPLDESCLMHVYVRLPCIPVQPCTLRPLTTRLCSYQSAPVLYRLQSTTSRLLLLPPAMQGPGKPCSHCQGCWCEAQPVPWARWHCGPWRWPHLPGHSEPGTRQCGGHVQDHRAGRDGAGELGSWHHCACTWYAGSMLQHKG